MNVVIGAGDTATSMNMSSRPRGTYLDPLKACALSGVSSFQAGKSESSTFTKYMGIVRQTRRNASRTSVLNDVEKSRFAAVMKRIDSEKAYSTSVLERQARMFRKSLINLENHKRSLLKQVDGQNKDRLDGEGDAIDKSDNASNLLKCHKGRSSRKRGCMPGVRAKGFSRKRVFNTRLPSISNESISESEDEKVANETGDSFVHSKPSMRTRGGLTLPVFSKSGDSTKATGSSFYTGNELSKQRRHSEDRSLRSEKLKLPAIKSKEHTGT